MKIISHQLTIHSAKYKDRLQACNNKNNKYLTIFKSKYKINI